MDFPLFHLDGMGNRLLIAVIAIIHVVINHPMAVGVYPLIVLLEAVGIRKADARYDELARRITFVTFIITTSLGAMTGVGIWFSTGVVAPFAIGSLLRVFFWGWFGEWLVFIAEVVLIVAYYMTWQRWRTGRSKQAHLGLGIILSLMSWLTMAIIVAVLGFMMTTGAWRNDQSFWSALMNPLYLPQLAFRTTFAMTTAGLFAWFLIAFFARREPAFRRKVIRWVAGWILAWLPLCLASALWYWQRVPAAMASQIDVALLTQQYAQWSDELGYILAAAVIAILVTALFGLARPRWVPRVALLVPFILGIWMLGHFERTREFIRKPYVIADYMYANGVRTRDLPICQRDGILTHATYASVHEVTDDNRLTAGREVFTLACSRCHTTDGVNSMVAKFETLYGPAPWDAAKTAGKVKWLHGTRPYMPPFPGNDAEAEALVVYIQHVGETGEPLAGAQATGVTTPTGRRQDLSPLITRTKR